MTLYLCDTNVWIALVLSGHPHRPAVVEWLGAVAEPGSALLCRASQRSFLRLLTNAAVLAPYGIPPPSLWIGAYLAADAMTGGYRFVTLDRGFEQFEDLDLLVLAP